MTRSLSTYRALAALPRPRSYVGKFLLVAFVGVHVPLIAVVTYVASRADWSAALPILTVALLATLGGTLATLLIQSRLLAPLLVSTEALQDFVDRRSVPRLPTSFDDEAGRLMRHTQGCIVHLDELLRLKDDLLATLSHDARSPLTSIGFASQMGRMALQDAVPDRAELEQMFDVIDAAAARQLALMNSMLTLARAEAGRLTVDADRVVPAELIERIADLFRIQAEAKGVALRVEAAAAAWQETSLDAAKTEQALSNLVSNAIKFTPAGGTVTLTASGFEDGIDFVVRDTGLGIPAPLQRQLFAPFSEAQRPGTDREPGTGLGLWICRTFTELQGGTVQVRSREGEGTEFTVRLPRIPLAAAA